MCRLYGFRSSEPTRVECTLVHAQNALMVQSRTDLRGKSHSQGWGIAAYPDGDPLVYRDPWPAFQSQHFRDAAARTYAATVIAHVRRATVGGTSLDNTHPFVHMPWAFAHNGTIPKFPLVKPLLIDAMAPAHRRAIQGETDSEHFFRFVMTLLDNGASAYAALTHAARTVIAWCRQIDSDVPIGLNVLLTDGRELVGTRWGRGLFFVQREGLRDCEICRYAHVRSIAPVEGYRSVVLASEPLTVGERWTPVPEGSGFRVVDDLELRIESLGLPNPPSPGEEVAGVTSAFIRTTLADEFMIDHRAMAAGFRNLRDAIDAGDRDAAMAAARKLDRTAGGHIAFEEEHLYPALEAGDDMYDDHDAGLAVLQRILDADAPLSSPERLSVIAEIDRMLDHTEDCGRLLSLVQHLAPSEQSQLEDRLFEWRERAPRWSLIEQSSRTPAGAP